MKTVLITGANSGIGFASVKLFLENGFKVFAHYNTDNQNLKNIENENLTVIKANFFDLDEVSYLFKEVIDKTETIDVLVNNAAFYSSTSGFEELNLEVFDKTLNVNLKAPFLLSMKFINLMKKFKKGRIINISSIGVKYGGSINAISYTISKSALEAMTITLAKEGAKYNILINALRIGVTNTNIHNLKNNKNLVNRARLIPLKRMAEPKEIAEYILFLSSEKSNFTTGSIITVAGGE